MSDISKTTAPAAAPFSKAGILLLAGITLFWGLNWPAMKIALAELPVWWFRTSCVWAGAIGLLSIAKLSGSSLHVPRAEIPQLLLVALFAMFGWHVGSGYGVSLLPAGRAAIIAFMMPVWAAILASVLIDEPLTRAKVFGLGFGLAGLAVLMGEDVMVIGSAPVGALVMAGAAFSWAVGTVLFKKYTWTTPLVTRIGWQLAACTLPIMLGAVLLEPLPDVTQLSGKALAALAYIYIFPMVFCQWAYFKVVSLFSAATAAIGTLAIPIVGVYSSALILGEPVGWQEFVALLLIVAALTSVLIIPAYRSRG